MSSPMAMPTERTAPSSQPVDKETEPQEMSSEELRAHLFSSLQARGVLSQLKSQLRCRLVQELRRGAHGSGDTSGATPPIPLSLQVANSIVAEHLRGCGYEFTLSTFLPESHTDSEKQLSRGDILHYLHLEPSSGLHTALGCDSGRGFLRDLLECLSSAPVGGATGSHTHSIGVQTEEEGEEGKPRRSLSLAEKLRTLDELHVARLEEEERGGGEREREEWRRECEMQLKMQMEREMEHFREHELSQARREERMHCETELRNLRIDQEKKHRKKMESIQKLEQDTLDSLRRKELENEATLFAKRQELQLQLQAVEAREAQLRRDSELKQQATGLAEQRIAMAVEQLTVREREVGQYRQQLEALVEERESRCRREYELQLEAKKAELAEWEARLKMEQGRQKTVKAELQQARQEVREERKRKEEVEDSLHDTTKRLVELQRQKEESCKALDKVSDHGVLKQQLSELRVHAAKTEQKLSENRAEHRQIQAEHHEVIKGLRKQLGRPNNNQLRILEEVERVKRECQLRLTDSEEEKRQLRREVGKQASVVSQQRAQLEQQALGLRGLEREVADLTAQLAHWQAALLCSGHNRSAKSLGKPVPRQVTSHLPSPPPHTLTPSPPHHPPSTLHSPHPSTHLLSETKATFVRLEQEAAELEKLYQQSHQRLALGSTLSPLPLTTPFSSAPTHHILTSSPEHTPTTCTTHITNIPPDINTTSTIGVFPLIPVGLPKPLSVVSSSAPVTTLTTVTRTTPSPTTTSHPVPLSLTHSVTTPTLPSPPSPTNIPLTPLPSTSTHTETCYTTTAPLLSAASTLTTPLPQLSLQRPQLSLDELWRQPQTVDHTTIATTSSPQGSRSATTSPPHGCKPVIETSSTAEIISDPLPETTPPTQPHPPAGELRHREEADSSSTATTAAGAKAVGGEGDGIDPLMLKYMELVKQKRAERGGREKGEREQLQTQIDHSPSERSHGIGLQSLSQATDSFGACSDPEQGHDLFQDW